MLGSFKTDPNNLESVISDMENQIIKPSKSKWIIHIGFVVVNVLRD